MRALFRTRRAPRSADAVSTAGSPLFGRFLSPDMTGIGTPNGAAFINALRRLES
jgi:hypothetical protein